MDFANMDRRQLTIAASGFCVMMTLHLTFQLLSQHLFYWKNPKEQKAIIIIIMMTPVYAIDSFVGLLDLRGSKQFFMLSNSVKECYEALAIAKFLALIYSYSNISMSNNIVPDEIKGREIHHSFPMTLFENTVCSRKLIATFTSMSYDIILYCYICFNLLEDYVQPRKTHLNQRTLKLLKYWTWQFVIVRPVCSILMVMLQMLGMYPSWLSWAFTIFLNFSFCLAMYSLVVIYHVFAKELAPHTPLAKFLCIQGIVFFCFWQGVVLDILVATGVIRSHHFWLDTEHVGEAIQNVLVSVEMVFFSVMQQYAYHVAPYSGDLEAKLKLPKRD